MAAKMSKRDRQDALRMASASKRDERQRQHAERASKDEQRALEFERYARAIEDWSAHGYGPRPVWLGPIPYGRRFAWMTDEALNAALAD